MNQFFYTRLEVVGGTPEVPEFRSFTDSFNVNKVIRTISLEDDRVLVLLDDLHERSQDVEDVDVKTGRVKGVKRQRNMFQSEIYLSSTDGERFFKALNIE
jgi:hypothetical protein